MRLTRLLRVLGLVAGLTASSWSAAAVLGLSPSDPLIDVEAGGVVDYNATTGLLTVSGRPATLSRNDPFLYGEFVGASSDDEKLFTVQFAVNGAGVLTGGVSGPDFQLKGAVDIDFDGVADYDGILLEGEVTQFGFQDSFSGTTDKFEVRISNLTGAMAALYSGRDLVVSIDSESSADYPNPFVGSFAANWVGPAKALGGSVDPVVLACGLDVEAFCSVGGGPNRSVCRIKVTREPKHWEHVTHYCRGKSFKVYKLGMHGDAVPSWASRYPATNVKFTYVVKNTGTTPISNLQLIDSFDTPVSGLPATLAPGASVTLTRTEALRESMIDSVLVLGEYGAALCRDKDTVAIKDMIRERRRHDDDKYREKGSDKDRDGDRR